MEITYSTLTIVHWVIGVLVLCWSWQAGKNVWWSQADDPSVDPSGFSFIVNVATAIFTPIVVEVVFHMGAGVFGSWK